MENYLYTGKAKVSKQDRILLFLKMRGSQPAFVIAKEFGMSNEGARLHLVRLMEEDFVKPAHVSKGVGRPAILYSLTGKGHARFPDSHTELTVQLLTSVRTTLGQEALDQLIGAREKVTLLRYTEAMKDLNGLEEKLNLLVQIRVREGYMAEWEKQQNSYLLIENHCPICAAATECPEFCQSELQNFQQLFGSQVRIERDDHIIKGSRRCAYKITTRGNS